LGIDQLDDALLINHDHCVRCGFEHATEFLALLMLQGISYGLLLETE
jgi:hypothetical protein